MNEQAFIKAVVAEPNDDAPRHIYADWLDEQGRYEQAEWIRIQCRISQLCEYHRQGNPTHPEFVTLLKRESELWLAHVGPIRAWLDDRGINSGNCVFNRGFLAEIACTAEQCLDSLDEILQTQPVQSVKLTTWPRTRTSTLATARNSTIDLAPKRMLRCYFALMPAHSVVVPQGSLESEIIQKLFFQFWPNIKFTLPERVIDSWTTVRSRPFNDLLAMQERIAREADLLVRQPQVFLTAAAFERLNNLSPEERKQVLAVASLTEEQAAVLRAVEQYGHSKAEEGP
jgi:uncharacterized protein (TIGR02996 family)